jgi:hypothetical protein
MADTDIEVGSQKSGRAPEGLRGDEVASVKKAGTKKKKARKTPVPEQAARGSPDHHAAATGTTPVATHESEDDGSQSAATTQPKSSSWKLMAAGGACLVIIVIIIIAVVVGGGDGNRKRNRDDDYKYIRNVVTPLSGEDVFRDEWSPQSLALNLMADEGIRFFDDSYDSFLLERYALMVLFYSTTYSMELSERLTPKKEVTLWTDTLSFLSDNPICEWNTAGALIALSFTPASSSSSTWGLNKGVRCNYEGSVTALYLGEFSRSNEFWNVAQKI